MPASKNSRMYMLDKYSHTPSPELEKTPRYGSNTYPGLSLSRSYERPQKKERAEHPSVSSGSLRASSERASPAPSPEISKLKANSFRMYTNRTPSYSRNSASSCA